ERNVAALTSVPAGPRARGRSLTVHQAKDLLRTAGDDRLGALVTVGLMLGLRPGELTGLCWEDVDFDAQVLHVRRARIENPGGVVLGEPKTPKSRRSLAMPQAVREDLARHRRRQQEERRKAGSRWRERGLVFCTTVGTPIDRWSLRRHFVALTERAGLGAWQPKELRHSAVSLLSAAGVPIEQVADVTGHAGTRTILDTYRHPVQPSVDVARAVMDELF
ncbi:MAG TPA: site-specific integrase, partial [Acidimicrobiales bacterium]|nr:site-specific integrase [Acidimicrobiales bacterium]